MVDMYDQQIAPLPEPVAMQMPESGRELDFGLHRDFSMSIFLPHYCCEIVAVSMAFCELVYPGR